MCGGGSDKAAKAANKAEQDRQARIAANVSSVNSLFDNPSRAADIQDFLNATRANYTTDLNTQKADADRQTKFALARNGTSGGSADVDANRLLSQQYQTGVLEADRRAQAAAGNLQQSDEAARQNLISLATSGANITNASNRAAQAFSSNLSTANQNAAQNGLSDLFSQFADTYKLSKDAAGRRQAARDYGTLYGTPASTASPWG